MIFLTAASIGFCAGSLRSAFSVALIAVLITVTYAASALVSPGPIHIADLAMAIGGYNAGLLNLLAGLLVVRRLRAA